jgi:uncharacterized membrane protein YjgN (DUF898 family)
MGRINDLGAPMTVLYVEESGNQSEQFIFTGSGSEYFRVWIVNLLLTILTLGIYSAWAKVRRMRYFYGNTKLGSVSFDYHGDPMAILRGRIVALLFFGAYNISWNISGGAGLIMLAVLAGLMPWLLWKSLQFKLYNTSYRGIRFGFGGRATKVYFVYLLLPLLTLFSMYLLAPFTHQRMKKFQHDDSRFGATFFSFHAGPGAFYKTYLIAFGIAALGVAAIVVAFSGLFSEISQAGGLKQAGSGAELKFLLFTLSLYLWFIALMTVFATLFQNLVWNNTRLGGHQFRCNMKAGRTAFIALTNLLGIILTLGLFIPFARTRMLKYRIESMSFIPAGSLDGFIETTQGIISATGDAAADLLDFDLSL